MPESGTVTPSAISYHLHDLPDRVVREVGQLVTADLVRCQSVLQYSNWTEWSQESHSLCLPSMVRLLPAPGFRRNLPFCIREQIHWLSRDYRIENGSMFLQNQPTGQVHFLNLRMVYLAFTWEFPNLGFNSVDVVASIRMDKLIQPFHSNIIIVSDLSFQLAESGRRRITAVQLSSQIGSIWMVEINHAGSQSTAASLQVVQRNGFPPPLPRCRCIVTSFCADLSTHDKCAVINFYVSAARYGTPNDNIKLKVSTNCGKRRYARLSRSAILAGVNAQPGLWNGTWITELGMEWMVMRQRYGLEWTSVMTIPGLFCTPLLEQTWASWCMVPSQEHMTPRAQFEINTSDCKKVCTRDCEILLQVTLKQKLIVWYTFPSPKFRRKK